MKWGLDARLPCHVSVMHSLTLHVVVQELKCLCSYGTYITCHLVMNTSARYISLPSLEEVCKVFQQKNGMADVINREWHPSCDHFVWPNLHVYRCPHAVCPELE